jgi:hypothetical protein
MKQMDDEYRGFPATSFNLRVTAGEGTRFMSSDRTFVSRRYPGMPFGSPLSRTRGPALHGNSGFVPRARRDDIFYDLEEGIIAG